MLEDDAIFACQKLKQRKIEPIKTWYSSHFSCLTFFETFSPKIYIRNYLKQFSTQRLDVGLLRIFLV